MRKFDLKLGNIFRSREEGTAVVEFAIFLPLFVLSFVIIVEFARIFFSYQGANVGVRDAARYLARITASNICQTVGVTTLPVAIDGATEAEAIIRLNMVDETSELPSMVFLDSVITELECVNGIDLYRQDLVPIVTVRTNVRIVLPLKDIFRLNNIGGRVGDDGSIPGTISDSSRVFGV